MQKNIYSVPTVYYKTYLVTNTHSTLCTHLYIVICEGATDYTLYSIFVRQYRLVVLYNNIHGKQFSLHGIDDHECIIFHQFNFIPVAVVCENACVCHGAALCWQKN